MTAPTPPPLVTTREALAEAVREGLTRWEAGIGSEQSAVIADALLASGAVVAVEDLAADDALVEWVADGILSHHDCAADHMGRAALRCLAAALTARAEAPK